MSYERLTTRMENGKAIYRCSLRWETEDEQTILDRLAELEDKLESGRLVELPCKVGDILYELIGNCVSFVRECTAYNIDIKKDNHIVVTVEYLNGGHWRYDETDFGKKIFITKEAAEARLKELQEEEK